MWKRTNYPGRTISSSAKSRCFSLRNELRWLRLRTGIAVFALPLSVLSALIATSRYYRIERVMPLLLPLMLLNLGLVVLGTWLVFRSIRRIRHFEHRIRELSEKYRSIAQFIE